MIIQNLFTQQAEAASNRYDDMINGWKLIYLKALNERKFGSQFMFREARDQAYAISTRYLDSEAFLIRQAMSVFAKEAQRSAEKDLSVTVTDALSDEADDHLIDAEEHLRTEIAIQIERDINHLIDTLRKAVLQVNTAARSQRSSIGSAIGQYRIGNTQEIGFFFRDRRSQKWPSGKFIRSTWRQSLLAIYNEVVMITTADHAVDQVEIVNANASAESHLMRLSLTSNSSLPTYADIMAEIFHPNSDAILKPASM
jgi:hypothetical protein